MQLKAKLSPCFVNSVKCGVKDILNRRLLRFTPALGGIVLAYFGLKLQDSAGIIQNEMPFFIVNVSTKVLIFRAKVGQRMVGVVNKISRNHVGMLVHDLFNASVSASSMPNGALYDPKSETWSWGACSKLCIGSKIAFTASHFEFEEDIGLISIFGSNISSSAEDIIDGFDTDEASSSSSLSDTEATDVQRNIRNAKKRTARENDGKRSVDINDSDTPETKRRKKNATSPKKKKKKKKKKLTNE